MTLEERILKLRDSQVGWFDGFELRVIAEDVCKMNAYIKRLEETGDKMASAWDKEWLTEADIEAIIDDWHGAKEAKP